MANRSYTARTAARIRTAEFLLATPDALAAYEEAGGLAKDLEVVRDRGHEARRYHFGQSSTAAALSGIVGDTLRAFEVLQLEYKAVMRVVRAVRDDLQEAGADASVLAPIDTILADQTAVHIKIHAGEGGASVREALKSRSQEDVRVEIEKDASGLIANVDLATGLAARRVTAARLAKLLEDAQALTGRLATRTAKKGERKAVTAAEQQAVAAQSQKWASIYPLLANLDDARVEALLAAAADRKK